MATIDLEALMTTASEIKNETQDNANTAKKVGGCLLDLAAFAAQGIFADEMKAEADADGVWFALRYHHADGTPYERRCYIPAMNQNGAAGVLTPAQYDALKAFGAVRDVGVFTDTSTAWVACARPDVAGNNAYRVLKYGVGTQRYYIEQSVKNAETIQYLYEGSARFTRYIRFSNASRTQVTEVQGWQREGARNIEYTASTQALQMKDMWGHSVGNAATLPEATTTAAGLLSSADKKKLDACVTTDATASARGLMTAMQVSFLDGAAQRTAFGVFEETVIVEEGAAVVLEQETAKSPNGRIVFVNRIGLTTTSTITHAGFLYRVGSKYYMDAHSGYGKPMPFDNGMAISTVDGCAYYIDGDQLVKAIPVATTSQSGLLSVEDKGLLDVCAGAVKYIGSFASVNAACEYASRAQVAGDKSASLLVFDAVGATGKTIQGRIIQQVNGLDECMQIRLWDKRIHRRNVTGANGEKGSQTSAKEWKEFGVVSYAYNAADRKITFSGYDGGELGNVVLPIATSSNAGLMSSAVFSKLNTLSQVSENIHLLNLGTFETMSLAYAAAAALNVCSNPYWESLFFTVGSNSFHIRQQVENDITVQTLFLGRAVKQRYIQFTDSNRTAISGVQPSWQQAMVRNLKYTASSQQLQLQSPWDDNVGSAATIPTVSSSVNGLAPKEWLARFTAIETRLAALEQKTAATQEAADTETTNA